MIAALTGITGNMGQAVLAALAFVPEIVKLKLLCNNKKRMKKLLKKHKALLDKIEIIEGGMTAPALEKLVAGTDIVVNMAAVIPPRADHCPKAAVACNELGAQALVTEIERITDNQPALVHISTVAVYGNRSGGHPFVRVGDPLLGSPLDVYSATKIRSEFRILESGIRKWTILRQSAMLHPQMLSGNVSDPLMYHTTFDAPLEWTTAHDSGVLIARILQRYAASALPERFWNRCFDIVGGKANRQYGMQTFDRGFKIIGGSVCDFFRPHYSATRNFHGGWFLDDELNAMFDYVSQTPEDYWEDIERAHPVFKLARFVPKGLIRQFLFKRLLKNDNAPVYWAEHNDDARVIAFFGSRENYDRLKTTTWADVTLPDPSTIPSLTDNATPVYYGFDFNKPDAELTQADLNGAAKAHGGELLSDFDGDMYKPLDWRTQDGEIFTARPYTVLRAGHWFNPLYKAFVWDYDRLCKKDKVFASIWYDTHAKDENYVYSLDERFDSHIAKTDTGERA